MFGHCGPCIIPSLHKICSGQLLETGYSLEKAWRQLQVCTSTFLMGAVKDWTQQLNLQGKDLCFKWSARFVGEREEKNGFPCDRGDVNSGDGAGARTSCSGDSVASEG